MSFYESYLFLEYMFANGNFKEKETVKNFIKNDLYSQALVKARMSILSVTDYSNTLMYKFLDEKDDIIEITKQIFRVRGALFHQSSQRKDNWNPNISDDFFCESTFLLHICEFIAYEISGYFDESVDQRLFKASENTGVMKTFTIIASIIRNEIQENISFKFQSPTKIFGETTLECICNNIEDELRREFQSLTDYKIFFEGKEIYSFYKHKKRTAEREKIFNKKIQTD